MKKLTLTAMAVFLGMMTSVSLSALNVVEKPVKVIHADLFQTTDSKTYPMGSVSGILTSISAKDLINRMYNDRFGEAITELSVQVYLQEEDTTTYWDCGKIKAERDKGMSNIDLKNRLVKVLENTVFTISYNARNEPVCKTE